MSEIQKRLIAQAKEQYKKIFPCNGKTFNDCFTIERGKIYFWFNDIKCSTHMIALET